MIPGVTWNDWAILNCAYYGNVACILVLYG